MSTPATARGWSSTVQWSPSGSVSSEQRLVAPSRVVVESPAGAAALGERYWAEVERYGRGLVRVVRGRERIEIRLLRRGPRLFVLGPPELTVAAELVACRHPILGGLLVRRPGGWLTLAQAGVGEVELRSTIDDFFPRLGRGPGRAGPLYAQVQSRIHVRISRRYFRALVGGRRP